MSYSWPRDLEQCDLPLPDADLDHGFSATPQADPPVAVDRDLFGNPIAAPVAARGRKTKPRQLGLAIPEPTFRLR